MRSSLVLDNLLRALPAVQAQHAPGTNLYQLLATVARREVESLFEGNTEEPVDFSPFGQLTFPFTRMGTVNSLNLMDLDELIIFSFYWINRNRYHQALDIGANLGLHSLLMSRCGYSVNCYEPDPTHYALLTRNLRLNDVASVTAFQMAVSSAAGETEFVRVLGNTTGSHLAGSKAAPYGELERFPVKTAAFRSLVNGVDLLKLDAEGHEQQIITSTVAGDWANMDGLISVHDKANAQAVFTHLTDLKLNLFSQKISWRRAERWDDLPLSHHEGTLFVSRKPAMPWE